MAYKEIESYGIIGDMHSIALVGVDGSIDWCCLPRFDSPSVFAALVDDRKGGFFRIAATHQDARRKQMYLPETNVLVTRFLNPEGVGEVIDFMPIHEHRPRHEIIRVVTAVRGRVSFRMECRPAMDYARAEHELHVSSSVAVFAATENTLTLISSRDLKQDGNGVVVDFDLGPNESATFALACGRHEDAASCDIREYGQKSLDRTIAEWKAWVRKCTYQGRWREMVVRSALALKLLTYEPTGAVIAAPTTSIPERLAGVRNWDYRYSWIRDSAFTIRGLLRLGYMDEAAAFMNWLQQRAIEREQETGPLQVMYGIEGNNDLPEVTLGHLDGYRGSKPVRIGNAASEQLQLDIYGELIDAIYIFDKNAAPVSYDLWMYMRHILDWVCENWERPDHGIWESRGDPQHFVYSKVQCWVALNRGIRMAQNRGLPLDFRHVHGEADRIFDAVMRDGWNAQRKTFTQYFGSEAVDANLLVLPLVKFIAPQDPRMLSTLECVSKELMSDSLVHRYNLNEAADDGLPGGEGTFSICTFWFVEALSRAGRIDDARLIFEKMLTYANHLGLYSEEIGPTGEALGNFPQALTHLGLISAAIDLDRSLGGRP